MAKNTKKQNALGSVASIQTILERYPVLITNDEVGNTSLSFTFDLMEILGITPNDILDWLSTLLSSENGLLTTLEYAIKSVLIASFKDTYTCSINPTLPFDAMYSIHTPSYTQDNKGIKVNLDDIDMFGILNHCPTSEKGSIFYFDSSPYSDEAHTGYTPTTVYSSTDFNAYLWYVINKGQNPPELKSVWDNRIDYKKKFENQGQFADNSPKGLFFNTSRAKTPMIKVPGLGFKKEILSCAFFEQGAGKNSNYLTVYINYDKYGKFLTNTKTVFEFNFDYIMSLKLFDSKTLVAQIINAVAGVGNHADVNILSLSHEVIAAQVKEIVTKVIENEDEVNVNDCYYSFSNEEHDRLLNIAVERYRGNATITNNDEEISEEIRKISTAPKDEQKGKINDAFKYVSKKLSTQDYTNKYEMGIEESIIRKFLEETVLQITLQVLSPKVMLLYAINEKILNPETSGTVGIFEFFKKFSNLILSLVKQIYEMVMEYIAEFLMRELKNILYLFIEKIMLEKIVYYTMLIEQLITNCATGAGNLSLNFNGKRNNPLVIEDVKGADIVPTQVKPTITEC